MADTLLHLTLAHRIAEHPELAMPVQNLIQLHPDAYFLGSALFDLPYYDTLLLSGLQTLFGLPSAYHPFGQIIHNGQCRRLCVELVRGAQSNEQLAMAYGALTHFAVDIVFHAEIERRIQNTTISHDALERQIGILCHQKLLGHSGVGTAYTITATWLFPHPDWRHFAAAVFSQLYTGTSNDATIPPDSATLARWQRSFRAFGYLYSKPWFPWLTTRAPHDPELKQTALQLTARAMESAIRYLNAAGRYRSNNISLRELTQALPNRRMVDGRSE